MKAVIIQTIATIIVGIGNYFFGYSIAWPSYSLEALKREDSPLGVPITNDQGNMVGSLPMLGCFISNLYSGWLSDTIGRKKTSILAGLVYVLSWSLITTASSVTMILVARFIIGIANGMILVVCYPFQNELTQTSLRGTLVPILTITYCFGTLMSYLSGWFLSYQVINYLNLSSSVIFVLLVSLLKETPAFLVGKGQEKEAIKSLQFYRGVSKQTQDVIDELNYLRILCKSNHVIIASTENGDEKSINLDAEKEKLRLEEDGVVENSEISAWRVFNIGTLEKISLPGDHNPKKFSITGRSKAMQRVLLSFCINMACLVFGGTIAVAAYAGPLFKTAAPDLSSDMCSVILAVAFTFGSLLAMAVNDLMGRRTLMISSAFLSAICLAVLASLLRYSWGPQWLIPATVLTYCCCFQVGVATVPILQASESIPPKLKSFIMVIGVAFMCIYNFIVLATFGPMVDFFGLDGTFLVFSITCAITTVYSYFFIKETKGLSLEAVEAMYEEGFLWRKPK